MINFASITNTEHNYWIFILKEYVNLIQTLFSWIMDNFFVAKILAQ